MLHNDDYQEYIAGAFLLDALRNYHKRTPMYRRDSLLDKQNISKMNIFGLRLVHMEGTISDFLVARQRIPIPL